MCRVPGDCRRISVGSDGRTEIQPCSAAVQACVQGPDETGEQLDGTVFCRKLVAIS